MEDRSVSTEKGRVKLRILVTGRNRKIAKDISEHLDLDKGYTVIKCNASKAALLDTVLAEMPHVIIVCAGDESEDTVRVFDILKESTRGGVCKFVVIANEDDRKTFIGTTDLDKVFFIARPVSLLALYSKLEEFEEEYANCEDRTAGLVTEFVNDRDSRFRRKHILVVDDDSEQLTVIRDHLCEFYQVTLVNKGSNAIKCLERFHVDLILLDYLMPEMSGPEVLRKIREIPEYADIPVVFLTAVSDKEAVTKTLVELKPQGYVLKPSKKSEMVAKIIEVLG